MSFATCLRALAGVAAMLAVTAAQAGERWRYVEPSAPRAVEPADFALGADGSLWTVAIDGVRRFDAAGVMAGVVPGMPGVAGYSQVRPLADGGAILMAYLGGGACEYQNVDASLRVRWSRREPCAAFAAGSDGTLWLSVVSDLRRIGRDGTLVTLAANATTPNARLAAMPDGGVALADTGVEFGPGPVARYGSDGARRWTFSRENVHFMHLAHGPGDTLAVTGFSGTGLTSDLAFYRFDANGALLSEYRAQEGRLEVPTGFQLGSDGSAGVLAAWYLGGEVRTVLYRFAPDGRLAWRVEPCPAFDGTGESSFALLPDGGMAVTCARADGAHLVHVDATGVPVTDVKLATPIAQIALRPDGHLQLLGSTPFDGARPLSVRTVDGAPVDAPLMVAHEPLRLVDRHLGADGTSWMLLVADRPGAQQQVHLVKVDAGGAAGWRRTFDLDGPLVHLSVAGAQACVTTAPQWTQPWEPGLPPKPAPVSITCVAASDGTDRWSKALPADYAVHHFGAVEDGTFIHVRGDPGDYTHTFVRYDGSGNEIVRVAGAGFARLAAIGADTPAAVIGLDDVPALRRLVRYDAQGRALQLAGPSGDIYEPVEVTADAALVRTRTVDAGNQPAQVLRAYGAGGQLAWTYAFRNPAPTTTVVRDGPAIYLAESYAAYSNRLPAYTRLSRIDAQDGAQAWSRDLAAAVEESQVLPIALGARGDRVAFARASRERVRVLTLDARDGTMRDEQSVPCRRRCAQAQAVALDADGTMRVAVPVTGPSGVSGAVIALDEPSAQPAVRLDQPGLAGAWWAPYAEGEGFVIDWLPSSRTWFMPWFTFTREGGNERSAQRWYTIGGSIPQGATHVELPIVRAIGGSFDAAGGVASPQVGIATLRFTDCDNGTLRYAFTGSANGGATGTITLSRLSPATQDCVLADGSTQVRTTAPANGFDARLSGSWHEEATAGQGFEFTVQPGGAFFAPWFTFDPATTSEADDPGRQRWYTLQGSLANAQNSRVDLVIAQALGGAFDSVPAANQFAVGSATLTITACDRATLDYRFADDEAAGDLRAHAGTIDLAKSGGCTP